MQSRDVRAVASAGRAARPTWMAALLTLVVGLISTVVAGQTSSPGDLDDLLRRAGERRRAYVETFKDLTSSETRLTELLDRAGNVERRRVVVSDFLVYRSTLKSDVAAEFRVAREVDGKAVGNLQEDGIALFRKLASARTLQQQFDRLRTANLKYALRYYAWGGTVDPLPPLEAARIGDFAYVVAGRDRIGGRDVVVVGYQSKAYRPAPRSRLLRGFREARMGDRGRIWLDAEGHIVRSENDMLVIDQELTEPVVLVRREVEYEPSPFGILTPSRLVHHFFARDRDKKSAQPTRPVARLTYTYDAFRRFEVATTTDIQLPAAAER